MERLTERNKLGDAIFKGGHNVWPDDVANRLADIEDILGPTYDLSRIKELVEADRDGRAALFHCKKDDILWTYCTYPSRCVYSFRITHISSLDGACFISTDRLSVIKDREIGKTVFLSREAAEKALEGRDGIDREEFCKKFCHCNVNMCDKEKCPVFAAPAADVAPVVHGRWMVDEYARYVFCSACENQYDEDGDVYNDVMYGSPPCYCQDCGAKMDGGDSDAV